MKNQLQKKTRTLEAEFCKNPGDHTVAFIVEYCGSKTWIKDRHIKKAERKVETGKGRLMPKEKRFVSWMFEPQYDMDGRPYHASDDGPYGYIS